MVEDIDNNWKLKISNWNLKITKATVSCVCKTLHLCMS